MVYFTKSLLMCQYMKRLLRRSVSLYSRSIRHHIGYSVGSTPFYAQHMPNVYTPDNIRPTLAQSATFTLTPSYLQWQSTGCIWQFFPLCTARRF